MYRLQNIKICNNKSGGVINVLNIKKIKYKYFLFINIVENLRLKKKIKEIKNKICNKFVKIKIELK